MKSMRFAAAAIVVASMVPAGCSLPGRIAPDTVSLADRCADIVKRAMPFADIDIGELSSANADLRTIVAKVTGTRTDMPDNGQIERHLAAECTFRDGVLIAFHWTKGGPP